MNATLSAIQEQNRLIAEQNALLMRIAAAAGPVTEQHGNGMMTDPDLQLILISDNILAAIDRWNEKCGHGRGNRRIRA